MQHIKTLNTPIAYANKADIIRLSRESTDQCDYLWTSILLEQSYNKFLNSLSDEHRFLLLSAISKVFVQYVSPGEYSITLAGYLAYCELIQFDYWTDSYNYWGLYIGSLQEKYIQKYKQLECPEPDGQKYPTLLEPKFGPKPFFAHHVKWIWPPSNINAPDLQNDANDDDIKINDDDS